MRVVFIGAILSLGLGTGSRAQNTQYLSHKGPFTTAAVLLTTGKMITGTLDLYYDADVIFVRSVTDSTYRLSAQEVRAFAVQEAPIQHPGDTYVALERVFLTLPTTTTVPATKEAWRFYEQLSPGPVQLVRREELRYCNMVIPEHSGATRRDGAHRAATCRFVPVFYLYPVRGGVVELRKPKDVLKHFPQHAQQLRTYARQNGLQYANARELSLLVIYANTLGGDNNRN
jgi:hypothetical protein